MIKQSDNFPQLDLGEAIPRTQRLVWDTPIPQSNWWAWLRTPEMIRELEYMMEREPDIFFVWFGLKSGEDQEGI